MAFVERVIAEGLGTGGTPLGGVLSVQGLITGTPMNVTLENKFPSYAASIIGLVPALLPTDIFEIAGSASKIIRVSRIRLTGTRTASTTNDIIVVKRSTANTGGTSTSPTVIPVNSTSAAGTAVVKAYTANPTLGTLVGNIRADKQFLNIAGTGPSEVREYTFGIDGTEHLTLNGVNEMVAVNLNGVTMGGGNLDIWVTWEEK